MSDQEQKRPHVGPPAVQVVPGAEGSRYVSPNTQEGKPKKNQKEAEAERAKNAGVAPPPEGDA